MKMFNRCDDKTNSEHNSTQSHAYSCNDLPCLLSFDIIFHLIYILQNTLRFLTLIAKNDKQKKCFLLPKINF